MKKPLSYFRHMTRQNIAKLDGLKSIMRVEYPRKREYWLVLPSVGDSDAVCVFLGKKSVTKFYRNTDTMFFEDSLLKQYADRITA